MYLMSLFAMILCASIWLSVQGAKENLSQVFGLPFSGLIPSLLMQTNYVLLLSSFREQLQQHVRVHAMEAVMACWELEQSLQSLTGILLYFPLGYGINFNCMLLHHFGQVCNSSKFFNSYLSIVLACSFALNMLVNENMITVVYIYFLTRKPLSFIISWFV